MGVMLQGFYWDCHKEENLIEKWWVHLNQADTRILNENDIDLKIYLSIIGF